MGGFRSEFDRALESIEAQVIELFGLVAEGLPAATRALVSGRGETVRALAEREQIADALYVEAEELAGQQILRQAPVASDLGFLLSVLPIVPELERSHDFVVEIASRAGRGGCHELPPGILRLGSQMGELACGMWGHAADAWYNRDRSARSPGSPSSTAREASAVPVRPYPLPQAISTRSLPVRTHASSSATVAAARSAGNQKSGQRSHRASRGTLSGGRPSRCPHLYSLLMAGYRQEFGLVLEVREVQVIELLAMIAEDLPWATAALLSGDAEHGADAVGGDCITVITASPTSAQPGPNAWRR